MLFENCAKKYVTQCGSDEILLSKFFSKKFREIKYRMMISRNIFQVRVISCLFHTVRIPSIKNFVKTIVVPE